MLIFSKRKSYYYKRLQFKSHNRWSKRNSHMHRIQILQCVYNVFNLEIVDQTKHSQLLV